MIKNPNNNDIIMFEVKTKDEFYKNYSISEKKTKINQLISYAMYEQNTKIASFFTYDFDNNTPLFNNIFCDEIRVNATNSDDFYDRWNKVFLHNNFIQENPVFNIFRPIKKKDNLKPIQQGEEKILFKQFLTVLRLNSISDKPYAFMKMINLFLCKIADEITEDTEYQIVDTTNNTHDVKGLKFQFVDGLDTPESFMKRLNELYKIGMLKYLNKDIIEYTDSDLTKILNDSKTNQIMNVFDDLRLKREHNFAFIEVYDNNTFLENFFVVKDIVRLLENYQFKYKTRYQFLGDFFENLLNTSLKQEAGQFFTPIPIVDYMVKSLSIENFIDYKIKQNEEDFLPNIIDYACGAGHFLISVMCEIQDILKNKNISNFKTTKQKENYKQFTESEFSWVADDKIMGIEKDYRLSKTTKIASFLNGDGKATIISGDGINKFSAKEYQNTILFSNSNKIEKFDYVISNPPYSVDGFMQAFRKNEIDKNSNDFSLLTTELNDKDSTIEIYFVERAWQLLKEKGYAVLVLPQSILSQDKYVKLREFIFKHFIIKSMLLTADITFSGTTTSPVILFLQKQKVNNLDYDVLINMSPKYLTPTASKLKRIEENFLGYSFSESRGKNCGTTIKNNSIIINIITPNTKQFLENNTISTPTEYSKIVKLKDIILNKTNDYAGNIYPKYEIQNNKKALNQYCKINEYTEEYFTQKNITLPTTYIEIGEMETQIPNKHKKTKRFCLKGDILISSLTPTSKKIVIAKDNFMLSTAIFVLSDFESDIVRDEVLNKLKLPENLKQMNSMLDGFKITYAKISDKNLFNNVMI
ncbi:MAG: N-6 DNA methylase [Bacteroidales bacterium]|jgi:type I restriction enzyme M protein|nr:N-6 DNA methylase [Bacteroidales bacterium]